MSTTNQKEEEDPLQLTPVTIQVNETDSIKTALSTNAEASALIVISFLSFKTHFEKNFLFILRKKQQKNMKPNKI